MAETVVASGTIQGPEARGSVAIVRREDGGTVMRSADTEIAPGAPDVRWYLAPADGVVDDRAVELGRATLLRGDVELPVPDDADLELLRAVVVHCTVYDVTFGTALLATAPG